MKKTGFFVAASVAALALCFSSPAEEAPVVKVTISDEQGVVATAAADVTVTDADGDGVLSICDALFLAHEEFFPDGAEAGFGFAETEFGLSLTKLWGYEGSFGYYLNNASPMSLGDSVSDGDYISAFCYRDNTAWSDVYCFFDNAAEIVTAGDSLSLTLNFLSYDESWNLFASPLPNAEITIDGETTGVFTDDNGVASVSVPTGTHIVSIAATDEYRVAPVCRVTAEAAPADDKAENVDTGVATGGVFVGISLLALALARKKNA